MQLSEIFLGLGEPALDVLLRSVSIGKLKVYQLYDRMKTRFHLAKLNSESLRKAAPRFWTRLSEHDEEFATDLSQAILVSHLDMIKTVLDELNIPHEDGFFAKGLEPTNHLIEGWRERVFEKFRGAYPEPLLLFYINHLSWEVAKTEDVFRGASA
jgi:hypothetical protein